MKTENEILTDIYHIITTGAIGSLVGGVYKKTRPSDSVLEDCIIHLIPGIKAKFLQNGALYVKIFYKDILENNTYFENAARGSYLEGLLYDLSEVLLTTEGYSFEVQTRETYTEKIPDIHQHYAILKMNFKLTIN